MSKAEVTALDKFRTRYELESGVVIIVRQAMNRVRRVLSEMPDERQNQPMESIAAACMESMTLPPDYSEEHLKGASFTFDEKDFKEVYKRFDPLTLLDQMAFSAAFDKENLPTKAMVDAIVDGIKKRKLDKPGK